MNEETLTVQKNQISLSKNGLQLTTLDDMFRFAKYVVASGFAPKGMEKPESILIAVEMGYEVGLSPMAALQNTAVVNGRPTIYGDAALALVRASGLMERYEEKPVGTKGKDDFGYRVSAKRKGDPSEYSETFTVADAKQANLWGKSGPWSQYPARMLKFRARSFLLRDAFGDVLKGMKTAEEVMDYDVEVTSEPKKPKLFGKKVKAEAPALEVEVSDAPEAEVSDESPEAALEPSDPPVDDGETEVPTTPVEALEARLDGDGLTMAQAMSWAKKQTGILARGKLDEFGARKVLNAYDTVREFIAREPKGDCADDI